MDLRIKGYVLLYLINHNNIISNIYTFMDMYLFRMFVSLKIRHAQLYKRKKNYFINSKNSISFISKVNSIYH